MDAVLIILGIMGFGAIVISAYVFTVAARNYVSEEGRRHGHGPAPYNVIERSTSDRRSGRPITFPLTVNGILITHDRRVLPERRAAA
ncbi:MAG: hypothetical protein ACI9NT_001426 [Bacteroidia bacterium]|jgi:hypothetical protein